MLHVCHEGCDHTGVQCQKCGAEVARDGLCRSCGWNGVEFTRPAATGSGEPHRDPHCEVHHWKMADGTCTCTPPASQPTVTLSKETREEVIRWMQERYDNCLRIASQKDGEDRVGWLHDALYFDTALALLRAAEQK